MKQPKRKGKMKKNILFIHGAWCSKKSFSYLANELDRYSVDIGYVEYDCQKMPMDEIIHRAHDQLEYLASNHIPTVVVGHSMGGLIALKLSQHDAVQSTVTLAAPLSGIRFNYVMNAFLTYYAPILREMSPESTLIQSLHLAPYDKNPIDVLVADEGFSPFLVEPNDGVITKHSQKNWIPEGASLTLIDANHNEILQSESSAKKIIEVMKR